MTSVELDPGKKAYYDDTVTFNTFDTFDTFNTFDTFEIFFGCAPFDYLYLHYFCVYVIANISYIHPVHGAGVQTHYLLIMSLLP